MFSRFTCTTLLVTGAVVVVGCLGAAPVKEGTATLFVEDVPAQAACLRVKIESRSEEWRLYDVDRQTMPSFELTGIGPGATMLTVDGFDVACRAVDPFLSSRWSSAPVRLDADPRGNRRLTARLKATTAALVGQTATVAGLFIRFVGNPNATDSDGGVGSSDAGAGSSTLPGTTMCQGPACVTFGGSTGGGSTDPDGGFVTDAGVDVDAGATASPEGGSGASPVRCVGALCLVPDPDGGTPPGSLFCVAGFCIARKVPSVNPEGGVDSDAGASQGQTLCFGPVCAVFVDRGSVDGGIPGPDGGAPLGPPICAGDICVLGPGADPDGGIPSGGPPLPVAVCNPSSCVILEPNSSSEGTPADAGTPGPQPVPPTTICFGPICVSLTGGTGNADAGATSP